MQQPTALPPENYAEVEWDSAGLPYSRRFGDIYYSRRDGLGESRYVFLTHNGLPVRWQDAQEPGCFTVMETGFGTGLNFLAAWDAFRKFPPIHPGYSLRFISIEKYPLAPQDLAAALSAQPELADLAAALTAVYAPSGNAAAYFDRDKVKLEVYYGDVQEALAALAESGKVTADAWYLDGFAPARNPRMWEPEVFRLMACLSRTGTSFSTYTAAGAVRRGLQAAGFNVRKAPGFGGKREMLCGEFLGQPHPVTSG